MAQLNSLLVTGDSRFLNPINGNARNGVYTVIGTQTASTSAWTGYIPLPSLYDGLKIAYYLPYASTSTNVTLNLTLADSVATGAINCYINSTNRITTQFGVGSTIVLTYYSAGSISVTGTATSDNRWVTDGQWNSNPTTATNSTTGISIADHTTGSVTGVQSSTTTASKVTLGTAFSVPNVTSKGSASNWVFEDITVPKAASSATTVPIKDTNATSIPNVTAAGSGSFTATVTNGVLSFSHVHTAPTLGTAISIIGVQSTTTSVTGVSGSTTASHVKSGGNGTAPTLGTAFSIPNVTAATDVTVPIKDASSTTVVTSKTHSITDNGHTHTLS